MPKYKEKVFKAKDLINSKPTTVKMGKYIYLYVSTNLLTDVVTLKNLSTREYGEIDYYELQEILNDKKR